MKTYINKIKLKLVAVLLVACTSCDKLLDVEMPANQITSNQVFETSQTANAALSGLYASLYDSSPLSGDQTNFLLGIFTDELDYYANSTNNGGTEIYTNTVSDYNTTVYTYWSNAYQKIYIANAIIEGVTNSTSLSIVDKNQIRSEAIIIRSMLFLYLQQLYGDIPMPESTNYSVNQALSKISANLVLDKIKADVTQAIPNIQDQYRNNERIFINKKVAQLVLAKILLLQQKWNDAEALLKEIKQSSLYVFQTDISKVFNKTSSHILWQLKPKNNNDPTKEIGTWYFINSAPPTVALSANLLNSFSSADLRKTNWIATVSFNGNTYYRANKYKNTTNNTTEYSVVFRLEEVYLLLAEALAQQNKISEALPFINAVKQRANIPLMIGNPNQQFFLQELLEENQREFFTEGGHRFFDLKRCNRLDLLFTTKPSWKSFNRLWPIPQKEILLNPNLNPQNIGY